MASNMDRSIHLRPARLLTAALLIASLGGTSASFAGLPAEATERDFSAGFDHLTRPELPSEAADGAVDITAIEPTIQTATQSLDGGTASYYGHRFAGRPTASGEIFDPALLTAAHRTLPFGSLVRVTNPRNGRSVVVRINDRGPFHGKRVIDLSRAAAEEIGLVQRGHGRVEMELLES